MFRQVLFNPPFQTTQMGIHLGVMKQLLFAICVPYSIYKETEVAQSAKYLGYRMDGWGMISGRGKRGILSLYYCVNLAWGPPSLLPHGYWRLCPHG